MREAVGVFDVSHLGKARVTRPGRGRLRQRLPHQRPGPDRAGPGAVHAVLRRRDRRRGRRPHRLPVRRRPRLPDPERGQHRRGGRAGCARPRRPGSRSPTSTRRTRCWPCRARARPSCSAALGLPTDHDYMIFATADAGRRRRDRLPHRLHRRARLRAGRARRTTRSRCGTRCSRPARAAPCGLGARDTLRTEMGYPLHGQDLSPGHHPGAGPLRLGGRLGQAGVLGPRGAARREGRRPAPRRCGAWRRTDRGIPRPHMTVYAGERAGRRDHQRHVLADPQGRHRAGAARHRPPGSTDGDKVEVDVRGRRCARRGRQAAVRAAVGTLSRWRDLRRLGLGAGAARHQEVFVDGSDHRPGRRQDHRDGDRTPPHGEGVRQDQAA